MKMELSDLAYFKIVTNIFSNLFYSAIAIYGGGIWLSLLIIMLAFGESTMVISSKLNNYKGQVTMIATKSGSKFRRKIYQISFVDKLLFYRTITIVTRLGCQLISIYVQCLILMGILLATCSGCVAIKLYDDLPFLIYICMSLLLPLLIIVNFGLVTLASIPQENGEKFQHFWKTQLIRRIDRMKLQSCPPLGYSFGFIKKCERKTALIIADVGLNLIATVTLLQST